MVRVGWAKALLRRAHHLDPDAALDGGHTTGRFASGRFAHPTGSMIAGEREKGPVQASGTSSIAAVAQYKRA
jgi:hypothetical protein